MAQLQLGLPSQKKDVHWRINSADSLGICWHGFNRSLATQPNPSKGKKTIRNHWSSSHFLGATTPPHPLICAQGLLGIWSKGKFQGKSRPTWHQAGCCTASSKKIHAHSILNASSAVVSLWKVACNGKCALAARSPTSSPRGHNSMWPGLKWWDNCLEQRNKPSPTFTWIGLSCKVISQVNVYPLVN